MDMTRAMVDTVAMDTTKDMVMVEDMTRATDTIMADMEVAGVDTVVARAVVDMEVATKEGVTVQVRFKLLDSFPVFRSIP